MKKINFKDLPNTDTPIKASTLNKMQSNIEESCVAVSPTQPETNEKVWIQKGKNLFKDELVISKGNCTYNDGVVAQTTADTKTEIEFKIQSYDNNWGYIGLLAEIKIISSTGRVFFTFTKTSKYTRLIFGLNGSTTDTGLGLNVSHLEDGKTYTLSFNVTNLTQGSVSWKDIQLEQGSTATEYEAYIEKKIYCKNDNGEYEEFVNAETMGVEKITNDNGTAVKYPDGKMECFGEIFLTDVELINPDGIFYYGILNPVKFPATFIKNPITVMEVDSVDPGYALFLRSSANGSSVSETPERLITCATSAICSKLKIHYHAIGRWK